MMLAFTHASSATSRSWVSDSDPTCVPKVARPASDPLLPDVDLPSILDSLIFRSERRSFRDLDNVVRQDHSSGELGLTRHADAELGESLHRGMYPCLAACGSAPAHECGETQRELSASFSPASCIAFEEMQPLKFVYK